MADKKITVKRRHGFTMVPNSAFDGSLPLSAIGLYSFMLSRPDDWEFSISGMATCLGVGRDAVRSALVKLEEAGFLIREQSHNEKGLFAGNVYVLYDEKNPPLSGKPSSDKPSTENPTQYNNISIQDLSKIPPYSPPQEKAKSGSKRGEPRKATDWKPERFEGLWKFYPKEGRQNKQVAMRAWDKLKPDDALIRRIGKSLKVQMQSELWKKGIAIPYLSTYLNGRRWENVSEEELNKCPVVESKEEEVFGWQM